MIKNITNGKHEITTVYPDSIIVGESRINWKVAVSKTLTVTRDGVTKEFEVMEYIAKPSATAHDGKVRIKDKSTSEEYVLWSRDLKQGDIAKLFKKKVTT